LIACRQQSTIPRPAIKGFETASKAVGGGLNRSDAMAATARLLRRSGQ
jgi:hypothetical protein